MHLHNSRELSSGGVMSRRLAAGLGDRINVYPVKVACCRFRGHRDKVFNGTGELEWREGSSAASSSLRR